MVGFELFVKKHGEISQKGLKIMWETRKCEYAFLLDVGVLKYVRKSA